MASTTAGGGAARGSLNPPHPNPSGNGSPRLRSPPGKGNKPVALANITNTGKPNLSRSIIAPDLVMENTKLVNLLKEKVKIIDLSRVEIYKLRVALQSSKQQNILLVQSHSQMLAELNAAKDRIKVLQHELCCTTALLKVKGSDLNVNNAANKQRKGVKSKVLKAKASTVAEVEAHHSDDLVTGGVEHHLVGSQSAVSSNTVCQEPPQDGKQKRVSQRRSLRLNQGSCEISRENMLNENTVVPLAPSTLSLQEQHGPTAGKHRETEITEQPQKTDPKAWSAFNNQLKIKDGATSDLINVIQEIPEACSRESEVQSHKIGDKAFNSRECHLTGSQSSVSFSTVDPPEPPEDNAMKRCSKKRSAIEDVNAKLDMATNEPMRHEDKRKSQRRKSSRLNSLSSEDTDITVETEHRDVIASFAGSCSNASMELRTNQEQNGDCSSRKCNEERISGRRSLRRAAEKVVSYKEIPLNVKMRRP